MLNARLCCQFHHLLLVRQWPEKFKSEERLQHSPGWKASQLCPESLESTNSQASISIESKRLWLSQSKKSSGADSVAFLGIHQC